MKIRRKSKLQQLKTWIIAVALLLVLAALGYAWRINNQSTDTSNQVGNTNTTNVTPDAPSDQPPSLAAIDPQIPVSIQINSIDVDAPIIPVGQEPDGAMAAPSTATDIGWYEDSALVGTSSRSMLLSGHYGLDAPEVLRRLNELQNGSKITVAGASGDTATYEVVETERQHRHDVDMNKAFYYREGEESLSIITCIGEYDHSIGTYNDRFIAYAVRVE